jgi:hypothetical protein
MSEPKKTDDNVILELIRLVDCHKRVLFKNFDVFTGGWGITLISLIAILLFVFGFLIIGGVILNVLPIIDEIVVALSLLAVFFAFFSLLAQIGEINMNESRFKRALKLRQFKEDEKSILKALIKMRSKNPEFNLEQIYNMHKEMFTKEKLLEKLYEQPYPF